MPPNVPKARVQNDILDALKQLLANTESAIVSQYDADETQDQSITLDLSGLKVVEIAARATTDTTFTVEVSFDGAHWFEVYKSTTAETSYYSSLQTTARYVRLSSAQAASGTVDLVISAQKTL